MERVDAYRLINIEHRICRDLYNRVSYQGVGKHLAVGTIRGIRTDFDRSIQQIIEQYEF